MKKRTEHQIRKEIQQRLDAAEGQPPIAGSANCSASPGAIASKNEILNAITRLETVADRCRHTMMGKEWTRRDHDADIIQLEVIPALRRALWVMQNVPDQR